MVPPCPPAPCLCAAAPGAADPGPAACHGAPGTALPRPGQPWTRPGPVRAPPPFSRQVGGRTVAGVLLGRRSEQTRALPQGVRVLEAQPLEGAKGSVPGPGAEGPSCACVRGTLRTLYLESACCGGSAPGGPQQPAWAPGHHCLLPALAGRVGLDRLSGPPLPFPHAAWAPCPLLSPKWPSGRAGEGTDGCRDSDTRL